MGFPEPKYVGHCTFRGLAFYPDGQPFDVKVYWFVCSNTSTPAAENLFPVADATNFFTDLHYILKVIAAGNIRTLLHHRLVLLEQKFNLHLMLNADKEFLAQKSTHIVIFTMSEKLTFTFITQLYEPKASSEVY